MVDSSMRKKKTSGRLAQAILETARDMRQAGILDKAVYERITMRQLLIHCSKNVVKNRQNGL